MGRIHLFELEDQAWFPDVIRDSMTDILSFTAATSGPVYEKFATTLGAAIVETGDTDIVELCAGGGGHGLIVAKLAEYRAGRPLTLVLTDLFPNLARMRVTQGKAEGRVQFLEQSVDARCVPESIRGFRLICNGFHHLPPDVATACLADAVSNRQGVAVVELVDRSPFGVIQVLSLVLAIFAITPFVKPFRWSRLAFTYVIPLIPLATLWDGLVSCLRVYSPAELRSLVAGLPANDYEWSIGRFSVPMMPVRVTYLIGRPSSRNLRQPGASE